MLCESTVGGVTASRTSSSFQEDWQRGEVSALTVRSYYDSSSVAGSATLLPTWDRGLVVVVVAHTQH